eukprot:6193475-Pleurochrysis_carterae.AAC.2
MNTKQSVSACATHRGFSTRAFSARCRSRVCVSLRLRTPLGRNVVCTRMCSRVCTRVCVCVCVCASIRVPSERRHAPLDGEPLHIGRRVVEQLKDRAADLLLALRVGLERLLLQLRQQIRSGHVPKVLVPDAEEAEKAFTRWPQE